MSILIALNYAEFGINLLVALVVLALSVWAFAVAVTAPAGAFTMSFKRTKTFWTVVTALCIVASVVSVSGGLRGTVGTMTLIQLFAATAAGVFLADVRPEVARRRR